MDGPEIAPADAGAGLKVIPRLAPVVLPQPLVPTTDMFPLVGPKVTDMLLDVLLPVLPEGRLQLYEVAPVMPETL